MEIKRARENFSKNTPLTITDRALLFILKRIFSENTHYELAKEKEPNISDLFFRMPPIDLDYAADLLYKYHTNQWNHVCSVSHL